MRYLSIPAAPLAASAVHAVRVELATSADRPHARIQRADLGFTLRAN